MIEIVYRTTHADGRLRLYVIANGNFVGEIGRTPRRPFRWSAWRDGRLVTSRARSKTDATEVLLEQAGALDG